MVQSRHPVTLAALWMGAALAGFLAMAISGRELAQHMSIFQSLFCRNLVGLLLLAPLLGVSKAGWGQLRTVQPGQQLWRHCSHYVGQYAWFFALASLPLAQVFALEFTVPLWTVLTARLLLGERITPARLAAVALGALGVLIILRPGVVIVPFAAWVMLAGALAFAFAHTATRKLAQTDSALCIVFYMTAIQLVLSAGPAGTQWVALTARSFWLVVILGVTALGAHYCMARALALAPATVVVPMDFLRLPLAAVAGYLLYQEQVHWSLLAGALLMAWGIWLNLRAETRRGVLAEPGRS